MKLIQIIIMFAVVMLASACSGPTVTMAPSPEKGAQRVAVLGFSSSGFLASRNQGAFAADKLSEELYLQKKALVVDRSVVNAALGNMGVSSIRVLDNRQLLRLAAALDVQIVIIGEVRSSSISSTEFGQQNKHISITVRAIDCSTGRIVGVFSHDRKGKEGSDLMVRKLVREIVDALGEKWAAGNSSDSSGS